MADCGKAKTRSTNTNSRRKNNALTCIHGFYAVEKLLQLRSSLGLSQSKFAQQLWCADTTVFRWESGQNFPDRSQLDWVCYRFNLSISEFHVERRFLPDKILESDNEALSDDEIIVANVERHCRKMLLNSKTEEADMWKMILRSCTRTRKYLKRYK